MVATNELTRKQRHAFGPFDSHSFCWNVGIRPSDYQSRCSCSGCLGLKKVTLSKASNPSGLIMRISSGVKGCQRTSRLPCLRFLHSQWARKVICRTKKMRVSPDRRRASRTAFVRFEMALLLALHETFCLHHGDSGPVGRRNKEGAPGDGFCGGKWD